MLFFAIILRENQSTLSGLSFLPFAFLHCIHHWPLCNNKIYKIPRAWLLTRSPVPAMDLKSNRSGFWGHMLKACRRLRRLCRKHSNIVSRHDKTPVKPTLLSEYFCRATWVSCRVGVTLCCDFYTFRSCNTCTFRLTTFALLWHTI